MYWMLYREKNNITLRNIKQGLQWIQPILTKNGSCIFFIIWLLRCSNTIVGTVIPPPVLSVMPKERRWACFRTCICWPTRCPVATSHNLINIQIYSMGSTIKYAWDLQVSGNRFFHISSTMPKIYYNTFKNYNNSVLSSETKVCLVC